MRQIIIDNELKKRAKDYANNLFGYRKNIDNIKKNLQALQTIVGASTNYGKYIEVIINNYVDINSLPVDEVISLFKNYKSLNLKVEYVFNSKTKCFYEHIVDAMNYELLREGSPENGRKYLLDNFRKLKIKTCVYCNSQYAVSLVNGTVGFDFDHVYPKSEYPYLSTNFFNLVPCCPTCNKKKSAKNYGVDFYVKQNPQKLFSYSLKLDSVVRYYWNGCNDDDELEVEVCDVSGKNMAKDLLLDDFSNQHKDVAEDVLIKAYKYTDSFLKGLEATLGANFYRLWYGVYENESDVYRRPLSAMTNDIVNQIKELKAGFI